VPGSAGSVTGKTRMWPRPTSGPPFHDVPGPGRDARQAGAAEAAAIRARRIIPLPPAQPVPDMLYIEVDGTGVPVRASETEGRQGKAADGRARTREIKLARLFTQSGHRAGGKPVMDPRSSSYVATFDGKDALAELVEAGYLRRVGEHFRQVVAIGDGAAWIWAMAGKLYPSATHITDIYLGTPLPELPAVIPE
jgi:hypothetical protein